MIDMPLNQTKPSQTEMIDTYLDLAREVKMTWNIRITMIPTVVSLSGMFQKFGKETRQIRANKIN